MIFFEAGISQSSTVYRYSNTDFFKGETVVFTENYHPHIKLPLNTILFTPDSNELIKAEHILASQYNIYMKKIGLKEEKNVVKKFYGYKRQYLGFIDRNGTKRIIIKLLNFKRCKKPEENYPNWESEYLVGFGEYYEKNTRAYVVNLMSASLSYNYSD